MLGEGGCEGLWGVSVTGQRLLGWCGTVSSVVPLAVLASVKLCRSG